MNLDAELERISNLSLLVASLRKRRAMNNKGRQLTPRAWEQWKRHQLKRDVIAVLLESFKASKMERLSPEMLSRARDYLYNGSRKLARPRGRPRKQVGMINSVLFNARSKAVIGPPRSMSTADERRWARMILGKKLALYAENAFHVGHKKTFVDTLEKLQGEPDPASALDSISDAKAIEIIESKSQPESRGYSNTAKLRALRTRFSRVKRQQQSLLLQLNVM